jgi:hypothetical protein
LPQPDKTQFQCADYLFESEKFVRMGTEPTMKYPAFLNVCTSVAADGLILQKFATKLDT